MDPRRTGEHLRNLRKRENQSLDEAALGIGVSKSALAMYERGERIPRDGVKVRIARYYGESVHTIFFAQFEH